jgi:hypothetical protein
MFKLQKLHLLLPVFSVLLAMVCMLSTPTSADEQLILRFESGRLQ